MMELLCKLAVPAATGGALLAGVYTLGLRSWYIDLGIVVIISGCSLYREMVGFAKYRGRERICGKTVIITGANSGIGKETAKDLAQRGARIILACRDLRRAEVARREIVQSTNNSNIVCKRLDLASLQSVRQFCEDINQTESRLDILINNAGVMMCPQQQTEDGLDMQMATNHFGHFLLTKLLLDKLKASGPSRVVILSSLSHRRAHLDFDDLQCERNHDLATTYGCSKLANIYHAKELARRLQGTGVTSYAVHPGVVNTDLPRHFSINSNPVASFLLSPLKYYLLKTANEGAQTTLYCALDPELSSSSGMYYGDCKEIEPYPQAHDEKTAKRLWEVSEEITNEKKSQ